MPPKKKRAKRSAVSMDCSDCDKPMAECRCPITCGKCRLDSIVAAGGDVFEAHRLYTKFQKERGCDGLTHSNGVK